MSLVFIVDEEILRHARNEPNRSLPKTSVGFEKVPGVYNADQGAVWIGDAICCQGTTTLGRWR